ncbi:MAG: nucleoside kinase, partial [Lachnospiraceae bacterium]|nr:nucleoside kinase [Lachnospiraceae bacterium]
MVTVTVEQKEYEVEEGISLEEIAKQYGSCEQGQIVLAYVNRHLCELHKKVSQDAVIEFVTTTDKIGFSTYKRSMILMMMKAFRDVLKERGTTGRIRVLFSIDKGFYCELESKGTKLSQDLLDAASTRMRELADADIPIVKSTYKS